MHNNYVRYETRLANQDTSNMMQAENESKSNDHEIIHPLGQHYSLPEPVRPMDPPQPMTTASYNHHNGNRLQPNYRNNISQQRSRQQQRSHPNPTPPLYESLPKPLYRRKQYYLVEMKEDKLLTQQQLDALSQHSSIYTLTQQHIDLLSQQSSGYTHISMDAVDDNTSSTTFNGNQPSTPSTTPRAVGRMNMIYNNRFVPSASFRYPRTNNNNNNINIAMNTNVGFNNNINSNNYRNNNNNNNNNNNHIHVQSSVIATVSNHNNDNTVRLSAQCDVIGTIQPPYHQRPYHQQQFYNSNNNNNNNNNNHNHNDYNMNQQQMNESHTEEAINMPPSTTHSFNYQQNNNNNGAWDEDNNNYPENMMSINNDIDQQTQ